VPYAFLVIGYGNEVFQFVLPSEKDKGIMRKKMDLMPFPHPGSPYAARFPMTVRAVLSFAGRDVVRGEVYPITMGFDQIERKIPDGSPRSG
jgi:hypothetical protein